MKTAAAMRALRLLLRRHPRVAAELAGAAALQAGRVGLEDLRSWLDSRRDGPEPGAPPEVSPPPPQRRKLPQRLTRRERRQLRRLAERWAEPPDPPAA